MTRSQRITLAMDRTRGVMRRTRHIRTKLNAAKTPEEIYALMPWAPPKAVVPPPHTFVLIDRARGVPCS